MHPAPWADELHTSETMRQNTPVDSVDQIVAFPIFPPHTNSLLSTFLTLAMWHKLKDRLDAHGFSFRQLIQSGCIIPICDTGIYAGSHDSYRVFAPLLDPVIERYHGHPPTAKHVSCMDHSVLRCPPLPSTSGNRILSVRVRVARNLAGFPLGPAVSRDQRRDIERRFVNALAAFSGELRGTYYSLETLSDAERACLIDDHFLFKSGDRFMQASGHERDWPDARGIFLNNEKTFLVWVNEEDHLRVISMQKGANISAVFRRLVEGTRQLETAMEFARDDHLGYISSCPTNLGTGLRASVHMCLPRLKQHPDVMNSIAKKHRIHIRGVHGEHSEAADGMFDLSNLQRLGRGEAYLVQDMYDGVCAFAKAELSL